MTKHAWRSPSKGDLWTTCTGGLAFIRENQARIDALGRPESSEAASQGTLAHEYAEATVLASFHPMPAVAREYAEKAIDVRTKLSPDILKNAELYAQWVQEYLLVGPHGGAWGLELSVPLWYEPESKGTADFWAIEDGDTLLVLDYKSGRNPVEIKNNIQITIYLIAIFDSVKNFYPKLKKFKAGVLQPFMDSEPKFWEFNLEELEHFRGLIGAAAKEVESPFLGHHKLVVSDKACRYCPAKPICPAQSERTAQMLEMVDDREMGALDDDEIFAIFKASPGIRTFLDEVEDYVRDQPDAVLAKQGFEKKDGRRAYSWTTSDEASVAFALNNLFGIEPYEQKLKTPAKVRAEIGTADVPMLDKMLTVDFNRPRVVSTKSDEPTFRVGRKNNHE